MTVQDYLLKFRKISSLESLEKLYDHLNYTLAGVCLTSARYRSPSGTMSNKESSDRL